MPKNKNKPKRRSAFALVAILRGGAGKHTDKRKRRNKKGRKYNAWEGWK